VNISTSRVALPDNKTVTYCEPASVYLIQSPLQPAEIALPPNYRSDNEEFGTDLSAWNADTTIGERSTDNILEIGGMRIV
jgi:hypothetical protein